MCGRYTLRRISIQLIRDGLQLPLPGFEEFSEIKLVPRFNIAPSQEVPIIRLDRNGQREIAFVRWGFIPYWTRGKPKVQPINARDDKLLSSPMYRDAMARRRCLVLADGFYEWQGKKPPKTPYFFRRKDDGLFAFAGLWERWRPDEQSEPIETCLHITTTPNEVVSPIHDRMPAILSRGDYERWLDPSVPAEEAIKLLHAYAGEEMETYVVSSAVNKPENDGPQLVERAAG
ncbi:MAG: SOS response-associated peptidase [Phycisphaerae bacterium]|nr:SOS response-associated peptidase [Phycisphaerae bacterium]